jgi:hypothetical protein
MYSQLKKPKQNRRVKGFDADLARTQATLVP